MVKNFESQNKKEAKKQALEWWELTGRSTAVCDWCNKSIARNNGYLVEPRLTGITVLGELLDMSNSPDLICEKCFNKNPETKPFPKNKFSAYKRDYKRLIK